MTFDEIPLRMLQLGVDRPWLCEACDYKPGSLAAILAPNGNKKHKTEKAMRRIWEALDREEDRQRGSNTLPAPLGHRVFLEPTEAQFDRWMEAVYAKPGRNFDTWSKEGLDAIAKEELAAIKLKIVSDLSEHAEDPSPVHWLPLRGGIAAGAPISSDATDGDRVRVAKEYPPVCHALRVFGHSMEPDIADGALVVVKALPEGHKPKQGRIVVYRDSNGLSLKRLAYRKSMPGDESANALGKVAVLESINPEFPDVHTTDSGTVEAVFVETLPA